MRLRHIPAADEYIEKSEYIIHNVEECRGHWCEGIFRKNAPLHIEIGMGKGKFITTLAGENPSINYLGLERYPTVLYKALMRYEENLPDNLRFLCEDARELTDMFAPNEVDKIYLNFSDPWPKDRHAKRRLTSPGFLEMYHNIIKDDGVLEFKTDNTGLFDYSLETINDSALWKLVDYTYDLHNNPDLNAGNIMTEYEEKFSAQGNPIHKLIAKPIN